MKSRTVNKAMFPIRSVLLIVLFSASSCIKDMINQVDLPKNWSPVLAFPVGKTTLTVNNFFYNYTADTLPLADSVYVYFNNVKYLVNSTDINMVDFIPFALHTFAQNPNSIKSILFRINIDNGYPSQTINQVYLLDAGYNMLDSILSGDDIFLTPGTLINDSTIQKTHVRRDITFTSDRIQKIQDVEHLRLKSGLSVTNKNIDTLKLFPNYKIDFQVGVIVSLNVNPDSAINTFQTQKK
jgi:hypothetical protein